MEQFIIEHITAITVVMVVIGVAFLLWERIQIDFLKPKYKLDEDGFVMYYYPTYNYWDYVCGWDDNDSKRTVTIHDTIRRLVFDYDYEGPGRYKFKMSKEELKNLPYKNVRELHREQRRLIDKEDFLLKEILKNVKS
jgi:hypothetical protein